MKIIRMVQQSIGASPRKRKEDDPNYPEYSNFTRSIDEDQIFKFLNTQGNKFDRDIKKLLKLFKRRSQSLDGEATKSARLSLEASLTDRESVG